MTKADIIKEVAGMTGLTRVETEAVFEGILESIGNALKRNERVEIRGFGNFSVHFRKAREARNPATKKMVTLKDRNVPVFKVSKILKEKVNKSLLRGF